MFMKPFLCFLLIAICSVTTSFGQEDTEFINKISREKLAQYSFVEEGNTTDVIEFKLHIQGHPTMLVKGAKMDEEAIKVIKKGKNKSQVVIYDIVRDTISSKEKRIFFVIEG